MTVQDSQFQLGGFNFASAFGGFALGAALTVLAVVAINPHNIASTPTAAAPTQAAGNAADSGTFVIPGTEGSSGGGGSAAALPAVGQTQTLANGTKVKRLSATQVQVTDSSGTTRTVTVGGSAGTAGTTVGGSAGSAGSAGSTGSSGSSGASTSGGSGGGASGSASGVGVSGSGGSCGGGGATDTGVTANSVSLGATVAESGIASAFLGQARQGMEAYKNRINSGGGICGRQLHIKYVDDGWKPDTGKTDLENLINEDHVFAIAVAPSSEGVNAASQAGTFDNAQVPVVGTDGLDRRQYKDPYIWPVASATVTMLHVMAQDAYNHGARNPAIVFDNDYAFGVEGAYAFDQAFKRLTGNDITGYTNPLSGGSATCQSSSRFCGIQAGRSSYTNEVSAINHACSTGTKCDYLVLLVEPDTAEQWMATSGAPTAAQFAQGGLGAAQPLFTYSFGTACNNACNGMKVWTGYNPPLEQFASTAGVKQYVNDLHNTSSSADAYNQFTEGCYLGMQLLVKAMTLAGGNLTRATLKSQLDSMSLDTGLSAGPESWSPGKHWAVGGAQAFTMQSQNGFSGWRFTTAFMQDPWLGQDFG